MRVFENTPEKNKPAFFLPRTEGTDIVLDGDTGQPIPVYDIQVRQDIDPVTGLVTYTRKSLLGVQQVKLIPNAVTLYNGVDEDNLLPVVSIDVALETLTPTATLPPFFPETSAFCSVTVSVLTVVVPLTVTLVLLPSLAVAEEVDLEFASVPTPPSRSPPEAACRRKLGILKTRPTGRVPGRPPRAPKMGPLCP